MPEPEIYLPIISIITTTIVGFILHKQIKAQRTLLNQYKDYITAIDPQKIITLHDKEKQQIKSLLEADNNQLKTQIIELGQYVEWTLNRYEVTAKNIGSPEAFSRTATINRDLPHCSRLLDIIREQNNQSSIPKAK